MRTWQSRLVLFSVLSFGFILCNVIYFLIFTFGLKNYQDPNDEEVSLKSLRKMDSGILPQTFGFEQPSCSVKIDWSLRLAYPEVVTNISHWNYHEEITCDYTLDLNGSNMFTQFVFDCSDSLTNVKTVYNTITHRLTNLDIKVVSFKSICLRRYIENCCYDSYRVPNIVHYVRFDKADLDFFEFISALSVIRFVKPCAILIHGNELPTGAYWNYILTKYPNIIHVKREPPLIIGGRPRKAPAHSSDIMRIEALIEYGGIYIDWDTVFVRPIDNLRSFPCTMSEQVRNVMSSAFVSSERNSTFVNRWMGGYTDDYRDDYIYNAMIYPHHLASRYPYEIKVLHGLLSRPWNQVQNVIFETNYKWKALYGIHLFKRRFQSYMDIEVVKTFNSTVGSMCRHILYGNKELCRK